MTRLYFSFSMMFLLFALSLNAQDIEPNNGPEEANSIQLDQEINGNISDADENDWYAFSIDESGLIKIEISKTGTGVVRFRLKDGDDESTTQIAYVDVNETDTTATLSYHIGPGNYLLHLQQYQYEEVPYIFSVSWHSSTYGDDGLNEAIEEAIPIQNGEVINGTLGYYKSGTGKDENDWYQLTITEPVVVNLQINKTGEEARVRLRDGEITGNTILADFDLSDAETFEELFYPLLPGTYLIQVRQILDEIIDYSMMVSETPSMYGLDTEPNDDESRAVELIPGNIANGNLGYYDAGVGTDEADWYVIPIEESGLLTLNTEKTTDGRFYIRFRDEESQIERILLNYEDTMSVSEFVIDSGKYYVFIDQSAGYSDYRIATTFRPRPIAGFEFDQVDNTVVFSSTSVDATGYQWDFGDGSNSTATHPMHIYQTPGVFSVCLTVENPGGEDQVCDTVTIEGLASVYPDRAGNTGDATLTVYGGGLDEESIIRIMDGGTIILEKDTIFSPGVDAIAARFDLRGQNMGVYDVEVQNGTGAIYRLEDALTIETGTLPDPWVKVTGRTRYLRNIPTTFKLQVGNKGNVDATMVPVWIAVLDVEGLEISFPDIEFIQPTESLEEFIVTENLEEAIVEVDSIFNDPFKARVFPFVFPVIPGNSIIEMDVRIVSTDNIRILTWTNNPYFQSPFNSRVTDCLGELIAYTAEAALDFELSQEQSRCLIEKYQEVFRKVLKKGSTPGEINKKAFQVLDKPALIAVLKSCDLYSSIGWGWVDESYEIIIHNRFNNLLKQASIISEICYTESDGCNINAALYDSERVLNDQCSISGPRTPLNDNIHSSRPVSSFDPNEKVGLSGYGDDNFLNFQKTLPYTVYFENVDSASAPAHIVRVIDTLDKTRYDLSSFQFGSITIADTTVYSEKGQFKMLQDIHLPSLNVVARVRGEIDTTSGVVIWEFRSLDPVTLMDIEDPDVGFLPPNKMKPEGEGNVSYSIDVVNGLANGDVIANRALIYFDANKPIITNTHIITLDTDVPESHVMPLEPESTDTSFLVEWVGTDDQSGVKSYDVFVSVNEGSFNRWLVRTGSNSETFVGKPDSTYSFFSLAYDYVGNQEELPERADATISLISTGLNDVAHNVLPVKVFPNPAKESIFFVFENGEGQSIQLLNGVGMIMKHQKIQNRRKLEMKVTDIPAGIYYWQITGSQNALLNSGKVIIE